MSAGSFRLTMSEPRGTPTWNRHPEPDDSRSVTSSTRNSDCRPNNWQSVDWPLTSNINGPRREQKKANQDRQQENDVQDSDIGMSPSQDGAAHAPPIRPPATYPRVAASFGTQRNDMDSVRQRLSLSEADEPDSNQIVGRLMQIRDYIKQTQAMMHRMQESNNVNSRESHSKLKSLVENLKEQEKGYLSLLQKVLASREEDLLIQQHYSNSKAGSGSDVTSELDVQSSISTETQDENIEEIRDNTNGRRPMIEDRLGLDSDGDPTTLEVTNEVTTRSPGLDVTLTPRQEDSDFPDSSEFIQQRQMLETNLASKNNELQSLREQHMLLKEMLEQQEQLKVLQSHQAALMALQKDAENQLNNGQNRKEMSSNIKALGPTYNQGSPQSTGNAVALGMTCADDADDQGASMMALLPESMSEQLNELHQKMQLLENCFDQEEQSEDDQNPTGQQSMQVDSEQSVIYERQQLQEKLLNLQEKKQHMDNLLEELQTLRDNKLMHSVGTDLETSSGVAIADAVQHSATATQTADEVNNMLQMIEVRGKLKKLESVKGRLDQLKELVQFYQTNAQFNPAVETDSSVKAVSVDDHTHMLEQLADASSSMICSEYEDPLPNENPQIGLRQSVQDPALQIEELEQMVQNRVLSANHPEADFMSDISSDFGAWGDDPDVKEKVRRLKVAKEKLHRLQSLITMVQHNPEQLQCLPDDLALLAASLDNPMKLESSGDELVNSRWTTNTDNDNPDGTESNEQAVATTTSTHPSEESYQARMLEQQCELEQLMEERQKILTIQHDLQRLHDALPNTGEITNGFVNPNVQHHSPDQNTKGHEDLNTDVKSLPETVQVTFGEPLETVITNEELYGQMRQQRILREELREKKKELEQFMKKDRPKRHYFRNQDNQSDNVSYSNKSDQFGASASEDVTMATWGGSTAGNLESIEENGSGEGHVMEECDDGYPSDGIVQVEEEEEEEEANEESDDRDTYTIEDEYGPRGRQTVQPPTVDAKSSGAIRRKQGKWMPYQEPTHTKLYSYNNWASNHNPMLNNAKHPAYKTHKSTRTGKRRMNDNRALKEEMCSLREQVQYITSLYQSGSDIGSPRVHMSQIGQVLPSQCLHQYQPGQVYHQELLSALNTLSERIANLEQNDNGGDHMLEMGPSNCFSCSPRSFYSSRARPFELKPQFPDSFSSDAYNANQTDRNWMQHQQKETSLAENRAPYNDVDGKNSNFRSQPTVISHSHHHVAHGTESIQRTNNRPVTLHQSLDNIPIDTVQAANEQAIREHGTTQKPLGRTTHVKGSDWSTGLDQVNVCQNSFPTGGTHDDVVIAQQFSTPMRAATGGHLADQQLCPFPRQLQECVTHMNSGIDSTSVSTALSSVCNLKHQKNMTTKSTDTDNIDSDVPIGVQNFESLRETIYAEVATLISRNEDHPHFLIELFQELQHLNSDYLRQRALYAVQDLVYNQLTEEDITTVKTPAHWSENPLAPAGEELTPSESVVSTNEEDNKEDTAADDTKAESIHSDKFDYAENVETTSSMSTPSTGDSHLGNPFAGETLGDTVIHLGSALQKMREYELKLTECDDMQVAGDNVLNMESMGNAQETDAAAQDITSDGSTSDVPFARIDTNQLDVQIKGIMSEIVPVLKEHIGDVCSQQLLLYIKRLVLLLTKQQDEQQENAKFFQSQLGSIVHDSLAKFEGRKLRDCGEDLLVDLSEILFNELAFFKLMQDLDDPKAKVKASFQQWNTNLQNSPDKQNQGNQDYSSEYDESSGTNSSGNEEDDEEEQEEQEESECSEESQEISEKENIQDPAVVVEEDEDLGKTRDDELARQCDIEESQEDEETRLVSAMKIELAPSETKPYTRIGSDEDDDGEDETANNDEPSDTAVARDAQIDANICLDDGNESSVQSDHPQSPSTGEYPLTKESPTNDATPTASSTEAKPSTEEKHSTDEDHSENSHHVHGTVQESGSQGNNKPDAVNDELTLDDLPVKLTGLSQDNLNRQMGTEQSANDIPAAVNDILPTNDEQLAGDPQALKPPDSCNGLT